MRQIKFRGQDFYTGEWRYGSYNGVNAGAADVFIIYEKEIFDPVSGGFIDIDTVEKIVKEDTVGQYTGLKDKHGVEIYEGDLIKKSTGGIICTVGFSEGSFKLEHKDHCKSNVGSWKESELAIIGNIYENPELLERK